MPYLIHNKPFSVLYGKAMALTQDNWHSTFVTYARLTMMDTDFEAQLVAFAKLHVALHVTSRHVVAGHGTCVLRHLHRVFNPALQIALRRDVS